MVDEAHATGAIGPDGEGAVAESGLGDEVDLIVGTLGKALGSYGAYVCASREITELLVNAARPFIFSTALPPPSVAAAIASLKLIGARPERVDRLRRNGDMMRRELAAYGLDPGESRTQIIPLIVGDADAAVELCERALERGRLRAGDQTPDRARGHVAAAHHGDGVAPRLRAAPRGEDRRHRRPRPRPLPRGRRVELGGAGSRRRRRRRTRCPSKAPPRPPAVGAPSLASQMPPGPLSIDLDEAA